RQLTDKLPGIRSLAHLIVMGFLCHLERDPPVIVIRGLAFGESACRVVLRAGFSQSLTCAHERNYVADVPRQLSTNGHDSFFSGRFHQAADRLAPETTS